MGTKVLSEKLCVLSFLLLCLEMYYFFLDLSPNSWKSEIVVISCSRWCFVGLTACRSLSPFAFLSLVLFYVLDGQHIPALLNTASPNDFAAQLDKAPTTANKSTAADSDPLRHLMQRLSRSAHSRSAFQISSVPRSRILLPYLSKCQFNLVIHSAIHRIVNSGALCLFNLSHFSWKHT